MEQISKQGTYTQNRELSWLKFDDRVLKEAKDNTVPLLERLNFISIFTSNLDEFYMIRCGSLFDLTLIDEDDWDNKTGWSPQEQLDAIFKATKPLYEERDLIFDEIAKDLRKYGIIKHNFDELNSKFRQYATQYFYENIAPLLSPQIIDSYHPFPHLANKKLYIYCILERDEKKKKNSKEYIGLIPIPYSLPNYIKFPDTNEFILMEDLVYAFVEGIFTNYRVKYKTVAAVTRNADINLQETPIDEDEDYRHFMKNILKFKKSILTGLKLLLVVALVSIFISSWTTSYDQALFSGKGNYVVVLSYLAIFVTFSVVYGGFKIGVSRLYDVVYSLALSLVFTNFFIYLELSLIARIMLSPVPILICTVIQFLIILVGAYAINSTYFKLYSPRKIIAIKDAAVGREAIIKKMSKIKERYNINMVMDVSSPINEIFSAIDEHEAVLICDFDKALQNKILRYSYATKKRIYFLPSSNDIVLSNAVQSQIFDTPILMCRNHGLTTEQRILKRLMDLFISGVGLIIASPFMIIIALAIKLYDGGPVFFKQNRVTENGKIFNVLKFRSMIVDADKVALRKATSNDDRITPVGKIIRPLRLDELPQLLNILFGDMSFVGPRPERTENVYEYTKLYPEFDLRHRVKGGLTGYAQIYGKYNTSPQDKLNMDLIYIEKYSLLLDIKLIVMTIKILFQKESTEGFDEEESAVGATLKKAEAEKNEQ